jgi:cell division septation protein DedD
VPRTPATASKPAPAAAPSQLGYKIEIPYTGDRSLEAARQAVPDAFLRPDGKIQLGAVNSAEEAQQKVQTLKNQGISAEVNQR